MKFSIIVPVYNVEAYLERCVESLINQTYNNIEIILVDDGSKDNSPKLCDDFVKKDSRIKVVHKENGGLSDARNVGLEIATGEYVLFVDSDDWLLLDACERFNEVLTVNLVDICIGCLINEDCSRFSLTPAAIPGKIYRGEEYYTLFIDSILACAVAPAYRRNFLRECGLNFMVGKFHEDNEFTPRAYIEANSIVFSNIDFYVRYVREDSITTHKDKRKNLKDIIDISYSLLHYSNSLKNKCTRDILKNEICNGYLSQFYETDIFQYKRENYKDYIDKDLLIKTSKTFYNKMRCLLFMISPRLYMIVRKRKGK